MQEYCIPRFAKGRVIKKQSMDCLREYPQKLVSMAYKNYSDGILYGFDICFEQNNLIISEGAIKYNNDIFITDKHIIPFDQFGEKVIIKLCIQEKIITDDFEKILYKIVADTNKIIADNEFELGNFCLYSGAVLRNTYKSVDDFRTYNNTLDLTNVMFAGENLPTVHPMLIKIISCKLMENSNADVLDYQFAFTSLNSDLIQRACILWYISKKLKISYKNYSNEEIFEKFINILRKETNNTKSVKASRGGPLIF